MSAIESETPAPFGLGAYWICLHGIVWREGLRFLHQRERFVSALVRPLVWLFIFAAGFRQAKHRGRDRVGWMFTLKAAAYNLIRLPKLLAAT